MYLYSEFYNVFVNLIRGSSADFTARQSSISESTNNRLLDGFNAVLIRLPDIATVLFLVLSFIVICWLPIMLFRLCKNLDPEYRKYRGRKK